jgi:hypothetical protein
MAEISVDVDGSDVLIHINKADSKKDKLKVKSQPVDLKAAKSEE